MIFVNGRELFRLIKFFVLSEFSHFCIEFCKNGFCQNFRFNNKVKSKYSQKALFCRFFAIFIFHLGIFRSSTYKELKNFQKRLDKFRNLSYNG